MTNQTSLLRALRMNAVFSSVSAVILLLGAPWVASQLGLTRALPVYVVGAGLVLFAIQLWHIVITGNIRAWELKSIIGGDIGWVIGSAVFVVLFYSRITMTGLVLVDVVALAVLYFAVQQIRGLKALRQGAA